MGGLRRRVRYGISTSRISIGAVPVLEKEVRHVLRVPQCPRNHALVDGNKRLAWSTTRVCCLLNGRDLELGVDEAKAMVVGAATGAHDVAALGELVGDALQEA